MTRTKILLRVLGTLLATAIAFCVGFIATGWAYNRWYVPDLVKQYPHDGQIGLAIFVTSLYGACVCAVIVLVLGTVWIVKKSRALPRANSRVLS